LEAACPEPVEAAAFMRAAILTRQLLPIGSVQRASASASMPVRMADPAEKR